MVYIERATAESVALFKNEVPFKTVRPISISGSTEMNKPAKPPWWRAPKVRRMRSPSYTDISAKWEMAFFAGWPFSLIKLAHGKRPPLNQTF
jgi:hypothetical protein